MTREALLNAPREAATCKRMVEALEKRLREHEKILTRSVVDRETYIERMGRIMETRASIEELKSIYAREFEV